ncbi:peptide-methionine (S)-S-oxide reductase [Aureococcus anophagefferens]|nr:peptide-methionine (S)-S-oxide reductase [Aureococcus anophagefferens]
MVFARWSLVALSGARAAGVVRPVVAMSSFALEAGKHALAGTTPVKSADGYAIATFAAGCFWGVELEFQRLPVIADGVGYVQGHKRKPTYEEPQRRRRRGAGFGRGVAALDANSGAAARRWATASRGCTSRGP